MAGDRVFGGGSLLLGADRRTEAETDVPLTDLCIAVLYDAGGAPCDAFLLRIGRDLGIAGAEVHDDLRSKLQKLHGRITAGALELCAPDGSLVFAEELLPDRPVKRSRNALGTKRAKTAKR